MAQVHACAHKGYERVGVVLTLDATVAMLLALMASAYGSFVRICMYRSWGMECVCMCVWGDARMRC